MDERTPEATVERAVHPAAAVFPMMPDDELQMLAENIREHELRQPIVLDGDGRVLDGRNRLAACEMVGVEPTFLTYEGDPVEYVLSANIHRRHLTPGQAAMLTGLALEAGGKRRNGRWARGSIPTDTPGSGSKAWKNAMSEVGVILDYARDYVDRVAAGTMALSAAHSIAAQRRAFEVQRTRQTSGGGEEHGTTSCEVLDAADRFRPVSPAPPPATTRRARKEPTWEEIESKAKADALIAKADALIARAGDRVTPALEREIRRNMHYPEAKLTGVLNYLARSFESDSDLLVLVDLVDPAELAELAKSAVRARQGISRLARALDARVRGGEGE